MSGSVTSFAVTGVDGAALRTQSVGPLERRPLVLTAQRSTSRFDLVALTWSGALPAGTTMQVRVREAGQWTGWQELEPSEHAPDPGDEGAGTAAPSASEPLLTAGADGVQVRVEGTAAASGLRAVIVDGGRSGADATSGPAAVAAAATPMPKIITRAQWGADESLVKEAPVFDATVRTLFVHHTVTTNSYTAAQAHAQVRSVYLFHTKSRGWNDIGYNFLVDRYGRVFEGRRGSITGAVHGAHTGGFNTESMGISVLGTYSSTAPTSAALRGVVDIASWKSSQYFMNPRGNTRMVSEGGGTTKFPDGKSVVLRTISGHRDVGYTECPGDRLYPSLASIRSSVAARMTPALVSPRVSASVVNWSGSPIGFTAAVPTNQKWWFTATSLCSRTPAGSSNGITASRVNATWNLRDGSGAPAAPGVYRIGLTSSSPVGSVRFAQDVEVLPTLQAPPSQCRVARLATGDVYTSAVMAGRARYPDSRTVVLTGSGAPLDGLVSAPLSAVKAAPLLVTPAKALPQVVSQDISSRGVTTAYVVGGVTAVSAAVETQLRGLGVTNVVRLTGRDRYAVAAAVARQVGARGKGAVVVSGASLADAAAAAGPAAAAGRPLLLVARTGVPAVTGATLKALGVRGVAVVGSTSAVPQSVVNRLGAYGVTGRWRITGPDRASTAVAVSKAFVRLAAGDQVVVVPSSGGLWAVVGAGQARLTVFTDPAGLPRATSSWLAVRKPGSVALVSDVRNGQTALFRQLFTAIA